ncbi:type VI secretion system-associated FHA domain protein [Paraliomyxa miuraensis]|uniref:type VI secretion system-associated FHA domain protein n=1 Tax=Paraliomyxa miuraensis TaxID=376150 RepID=UPI00225262FA|nr:type VI secretion system-associated FHA domain protein [Paraliomyxa miuraensis]MCX4243025.1 FHA domain-containing protein [Paraliomyxa miuraensis]
MRPVVITVFDSEAGTTSDHTFATSPVRIGRNPLNDLPLPFPFVSGWHAVVRFDDGQAKFFDLGSTNGTLLNGRKIQAGEPVVIGEMLSVTIGKLELRFSRGEMVSSMHQAGYAPPAPVADPYVPQPPPPVYGHAGNAMTGTIDRQPSMQMPAAPGGNTAHVQMSDVHQAIHRLRPAYDAYRQAWTRVQQELQSSLTSMHPSLHEFAVSVLAREFPAVAHESDFGGLARRLGARVPGAGGGGGGDGAEGMAAVQRLAQGVRPDEEPPRSAEEAERFLACVEDVLRASAKAFVELQKGQEQFGREMGVRTIKEFTPLHAAGTPDNVLKYLLDWQKGGPHRTQELVGVYADVMIHQVALINGVMEGVRSLLARLDPTAIERGVSSAWGSRAAVAWKAFVQRYQELTEADRNITEHVFGPEFARAYAEVGGEGSRG